MQLPLVPSVVRSSFPPRLLVAVVSAVVVACGSESTPSGPDAAPADARPGAFLDGTLRADADDRADDATSPVADGDPVVNDSASAGGDASSDGALANEVAIGDARADAKAADANATDAAVDTRRDAGSPVDAKEAGSITDAGPAVPLPPQLCVSPLALANTSSPTTVVGTGSPDSCTEASLRAAIAKGGVVTFACGPGSKTIVITQTLVAPADKDTVIDGVDAIVLDGAGTTQILRAVSANFRANDHVLTVQRLTMRRGRDLGAGFVPRDGEKTCAWGYKTGGGGAIYVRDLIVRLWGVHFVDNQGPLLGPDVAGGALYVVGSKRVTVANSTFVGNSAANGGAMGFLHAGAYLYNVTFDDNVATGLKANFAGATGCPPFNHDEQGGAGGLGGAFYTDGFDPETVFCGVRMSGNTSGDLGGAVFRSAYWGLIPNAAKQVSSWEKTTFDRNQSPEGGGGAAYVNNSLLVLKDVTFTSNNSGKGDGGALKITGVTVQATNATFTNNAGTWGGAVAHWGVGPEGAGTAAGIKFAGNAPNDAVGDFPK